MSKNQEQSVLIIDGNRFDAVLALSCLHQVPNYKTHVLATDPQTPLAASRLPASFHLRETNQDDEKIQAIREVAGKVGATLLMPVSRLGTSFTIKNLSALKEIAPVVPVPSLGSFEIAENKGMLASFLKDNDLPMPPTLHGTFDAHFFEDLSTMQFPVLLKPYIGTSGNGIHQFKDYTSLEEFLKKNQGSLKPFIIQSKLRGKEMAGNVLAKEGEILAHSFQQEVIPNPIPYRYPSAVKFAHHPEAFELVKQLVAKLNWSGVANFGLFMDADDNKKVKLIEINPRYWGRLRGSLKAGINFPHLACLAGLNQPLPPNEYKNCKFVELKDWLNILIYSSRRADLLKLGPTAIGWRYVLQDPFPFFNIISNKLKSIKKPNPRSS